MNNSTYIAHSENSNGIKQTMEMHSKGFCGFMKEFALSESFADLYGFCGLIHDIGKYSDDFQKHIAGENNKVKHSVYGAIYAIEKKLLEVALPVFGHHAGLPDRPDILQNIKAETNEDAKYNSICGAWKNDLGGEVIVPDEITFRNLPDVLQKELFVRLLFSSLVDADSLDTERHFFECKFSNRESPSFESDKLLVKLQEEFEHLENDPTKKINKLRNEVRLFAESKAHLPQGCFSLTLPTGLGKTLCSINWALHHAQHHPNIKRIIIVLPFINIIDQTAEKLKSIFNDEEGDYVLEHHSNVIYANNEDRDEYNPKQLATDNWDYPIIITTSVQFFESLFSNRRSACRKLHNIQDSIIIFDEIQTLPIDVTEPTLIMLDNLQQLCRCSLLFCTATQPDFQTRNGFSGISHIESLVEDPKRIFDETRRVTYHPINSYNEITISKLADIVVMNRKSALVVFNTKKKARLFFDEMKGCDGYRLFHLSTNMCPSHRKETIRAIREALQKEERIVVSSTQLIEAGVDMDFPTVYRELAPLESIIQSAGRCNREGGLKDEDGNPINGDVYLFSLAESGQPSKQYSSWSEFANLLYKGNEERLYSHDFYSFYYRELIKNYAETDKLHITEDRKRWLYQTVAEKYKIIDGKALSLFVYDYNRESNQLYNKIKDKEYLFNREWQQISQYSVQVYINLDEKELRRDKRFQFLQCGVVVWLGPYSYDLGLVLFDELNLLMC